MDAKLIKLGGKSAGLSIPLKKAKFVIGRSSECSLRAGSDAISRRHCEIRLTKSSIHVVDLGSRNGTLVNGKAIKELTELKSGDNLTVGPLKFEVSIEHGLDTTKRPQVKDVADATARAAEKGRQDNDNYEDSITQWLTMPATESGSLNETASFRMDETNTSFVPKPHEKQEETAEDNESAEDADGDDDKKKIKPGKLPPVPKKPMAKDSRDAAAEVLREMTRRR